MYDLSGKVALVTGAGGERGFGRAIAMRLAHEGADIIVNDIVQNPVRRIPIRLARAAQPDEENQSVRPSAPLSPQNLPTARKLKRWCARELSTSVISIFWSATPPSSHGRDLVPVVDLDEDVWDSTLRVN